MKKIRTAFDNRTTSVSTKIFSGLHYKYMITHSSRCAFIDFKPNYFGELIWWMHILVHIPPKYHRSLVDPCR
ncbi:Hypothetical predicted protein [Octopus vulgaris]|uniref:Uncharacterized protein n=1 Tax=Octopus vulgaris TaxID=6645 RepID=A0AA36BAQ2_OCTVU|nr:Hypothetical predicted protein [Octopus vulgaris]